MLHIKIYKVILKKMAHSAYAFDTNLVLAAEKVPENNSIITYFAMSPATIRRTSTYHFKNQFNQTHFRCSKKK